MPAGQYRCQLHWPHHLVPYLLAVKDVDQRPKTPPPPGLNASLIDLGNRFRLLVNEVEVVAPEKPLPKLPVARALWAPKPNLALGAAAWIYAGGAHHTGFSQAVTSEMLEDFADIAGIELVLINEETNLRRFKQELRWNEVYYGLRSGWVS